MKWRLLAGLSVLVLGLLLSEAHGDLIGPRRPGLPVPPPGGNPFLQPGARPLPVRVKLVVKTSEKLKSPVLQVPVNLALGRNAHPGFGQAPEADPQAPAEGGRRFGLSTIVAGLALTLAFASGGLWLTRRGSRRALTVAIVTSVFVAGTAGVWADLAPIGPRPRPVPPAPPAPGVGRLTPLKLPANIELTDNLILEPVAPADHLTLIVPKSMVAEKAEDGEKKAAPRDKRSR